MINSTFKNEGLKLYDGHSPSMKIDGKNNDWIVNNEYGVNKYSNEGFSQDIKNDRLLTVQSK